MKVIIAVALLAVIFTTVTCIPSPDPRPKPENSDDYELQDEEEETSSKDKPEDVDEEEQEEDSENGSHGTKPDDEEETEETEEEGSQDQTEEEEESSSESEGPSSAPTGDTGEEETESAEEETPAREEVPPRSGKSTQGKQKKGAEKEFTKRDAGVVPPRRGKSTQGKRRVDTESASRSGGRNNVELLSQQDRDKYWRIFDFCLPKMQGTYNLEQRLVSGDIEELEYYDKCTILCFFYDTWIAENGNFDRNKLKKVLYSYSGNDVESVMSQCIEHLPVDCEIAYKIYKCFHDKQTPVFFQIYRRR